MYILKLLFTFAGRINRLEYLTGVIIAYTIFALFAFLPLAIPISYEAGPPLTKLLIATIYLIGMVIYLYINLALGTKRLRDLEWTFWLLPLFVIPIASLVMKLLGIFVPGVTNGQRLSKSIR